MDDVRHISSGYTIDLYCRNENNGCACPEYLGNEPQDMVATEGPHCYYEARKEARRRGWTLHKDGTATCPYCNGKKKQPK